MENQIYCCGSSILLLLQLQPQLSPKPGWEQRAFLLCYQVRGAGRGQLAESWALLALDQGQIPLWWENSLPGSCNQIMRPLNACSLGKNWCRLPAAWDAVLWPSGRWERQQRWAALSVQLTRNLSSSRLNSTVKRSLNIICYWDFSWLRGIWNTRHMQYFLLCSFAAWMALWGSAAEQGLFHPLSNEALSKSYFYQLVVACMKQIISLQLLAARCSWKVPCAASIVHYCYLQLESRPVAEFVTSPGCLCVFHFLPPAKKKHVWSHCGGFFCCCWCCVPHEWINKGTANSRSVFWSP